MEFSEVVRKRRMVHVFEQRPVARELIDRLLDIARRAPSAGFSQGYDFLVLDEAASIARFWELTEDPQFPREPGEIESGPTVIVLAYSDASRYVERYSRPDKIAFGLDRAEAWPVPFWDTDTAMACQNLLLAAVDAGLGSWFFGVNHGRDEIAGEFGVPEGREMIGIVGLGYEGVDERPRGSAYSLKRRPFEEQVHRNGW